MRRLLFKKRLHIGQYKVQLQNIIQIDVVLVGIVKSKNGLLHVRCFHTVMVIEAITKPNQHTILVKQI